MYRILEDNQQVCERRNVLGHPHYSAHELLATGPNQVWSWDITRLLGPMKWTYFHFFVILDIFSRYVVGWLLAEHESASLASSPFHADRGAAMKAKTTAQLLADLDIVDSHSRPRGRTTIPTPSRTSGPSITKQLCLVWLDTHRQRTSHASLAVSGQVPGPGKSALSWVVRGNDPLHSSD
jgi:hypothetical protein